MRTVTTYDIRGNVEKVREASDPRSVVTRYEYDRRGRTKKRILDSGGTQQVTYETVYDSVGNVKEEWNLTAGTKTVHDYDRLNRRTKTTLPDPDGIPGGATGSASEVKTFSFDVAGNLIAETNGENETTRWLYDEQGNVVSETDGNGDETRYRYDSEGNQTAVIDAEQNVTRYKYDGLNRVTDETIKATVSSTDTLLARHYVYSAAGNLERIFDRNNRHIHYLYDSLDRKITEYWRPTAYVYGEAPVHVLSWEYDKLGRVIKQVDGNANYGSAADDLVDTYVYDGLGRVTQQANYDPNQTNQGSGSGVPRVRQEFEYEYRHESGAFHDRVIRSQFGPFGGSEVAIAETISEYDRLGRLKSLDDLDNDPGAATPVVGQKSLTFSYDTADNLTGISRSNPSTTVNSTLVYDRTNRVTSVTHDLGPAGSSATDIVHSYGYDNASRVTSFNTTGSVAATRAYQYDDAGQLTSKSGSTGPESYTYDDNGNRELVTNGQGTNQDYVAAHANRLESDGTYTYQYDKEGNVTDRWVTLDPGQRIYYTWDHRNRLTKVSEWNGDHEVLIVDYKYDASGRLVSKATNRPFDTGIVETEYFVHDSNGASGSALALSFSKVGTAAATLEHRYLHGPADQVLVDEVFNAAGQSTDVLWPLGDHQGTPRDVVDDNGVLRKHTTFDSFGRITGEQFFARNGSSISSTHAEAVDQAIAYTGQFRDRDTGLQLHGRRWYDPGTGRWLSEDPTGFAGGDANLYRYVGNSPLNHTDSSGTTQAGNPFANLNLFGSTTIPNLNANLGLSHYNSSPLNPTNIVSSLIAPPAPSFVSAFDSGTGNVSDLDAISSSLSAFRYPTREEYAYAQANPHGPAVKVETIESTVHGDKFRAGPDTASYLERQNRSYVEWAARGIANFAREIPASTIDAIFPPSDPSYVVTYRDGTQYLYIGEGPSTGHLAGQAAFIASVAPVSVSRPAGSLTLRDSRIENALRNFHEDEFGGLGSYTNTHQSGKTYSGKGDTTQMSRSGRRIARTHDDPVVDQQHTTAADTKQSFIDEQNRIELNGGPGGNTYNKINSPGKKLRDGT